MWNGLFVALEVVRKLNVESLKSVDCRFAFVLTLLFALVFYSCSFFQNEEHAQVATVSTSSSSNSEMQSLHDRREQSDEL